MLGHSTISVQSAWSVDTQWKHFKAVEKRKTYFWKQTKIKFKSKFEFVSIFSFVQLKYIIRTFICTVDRSHFSAGSTYFRLWRFYSRIKVLCHNIKNKIFFLSTYFQGLIRNWTRLESENQWYHGLSGDIIPRNVHGTIFNQKL